MFPQNLHIFEEIIQPINVYISIVTKRGFVMEGLEGRDNEGFERCTIKGPTFVTRSFKTLLVPTKKARVHV